MEWLVEITVQIPADLAGDQRTELLEREQERGEELARAGVLRAIWRVPGRRANCGIWSAPDATQLHEALVSLPLWPYLAIGVTPLAAHPLTGSCAGLVPVTARETGAT
jgi:muconolactone D-isomerase